MKSTGNGFIGNIRHIEVDYDKKNYCGHPRQCGIANFGGGELATLYWRAPCNYEEQSDISHSFYDGYLSRADVVLRRSLDHGETWPADNDVIVWSNAWSLVRRRDFLSQDPARRDILDMSGPEAMFFFGRTSMFRWDPEATTHSEYLPVFQIRSVDKGHTWEDVPVVLDPPPSIAGILKDNHPPVTMPDGARVGTMTAPHPGSVWLYGSENHGMTWPLYLGFFEFVHNMRKRGKALLEFLIKGVLGTAPWNP